MTSDRSGRRLALAAFMVLAVSTIAAGGFWYFQNDMAIPGDASDLDQVAFGSRVYSRICANCHGTEMNGQLGWEEPLRDGTRLAPAHSTEGETWHRTDEALYEVVKFGGESLKSDGKVSRMPGFEKKLTDAEIWAVIAFIKSTWPADIQEQQQNVAVDEGVE